MRLLPTLIATALLLATACSTSKGPDRQASCTEITEAITALGTDPLVQTASGTANVQQFADTYTKTATRIRTAAASADDPAVKSAATEIADALDLLTKAVTSPTPSGPDGLTASTRLATAADTFQKTCTPPTP
ncbi:hypothetical protein [Actinocorallia lasiicapitis]